MTWHELIDSYLRELRARRRSAALCVNERGALKKFQTYCAGRNVIFVEAIKLDDLLAYCGWLQDRRLKALTRHALLGSVRRWLKWATARGHLLENPAAFWRPRLPPTPFRRIPTEAQMLSLLEAPSAETLPGQRDRVLLEFLYGTGLRVQECADVDLADMDLCQGTVIVRSGKGGKGRCLPLGPKLTALLSKYLQDIRPYFDRGKTTALFLDDKGGRLQDHCIDSRLRLYSKKTFSTHSIRYAFATHLLLGGAPVWAVGKLLGHECLDSTIRYTRLLQLDVQAELLRCHPRATTQASERGKSPQPEE